MRISRLIGSLALFICCSVYAGPKDPVMLNFVNADIDTVVKAIGEITGKTFVIDPRVKGTINIISARPVPRDLSYQILLSSLRLQGYSAIEDKGVIKVVPESEAKLHAKIGSPRRNDGDRLITKIFVLKNANANQLMPVIRPLVSPNNTINAFPQGNALVVTDYADNIQRVESIIDSVEAASAGDYAIIPVQYGSAVELANMVTRLMQEAGGGADGGGKTTIISDARSNVIMVRADTPGKVGQVKSLIKMLDQPSQAGANVRVVYLKNAEAEKVAQMLRILLTSQGGMGGGGGASASSTSSAPASSGGMGVGGAGTGGSSSGSSSIPDFSKANTGGAVENLSGTGAMVMADVSNNALILNVPDAMYQNLRNVIDLLDRRRAQVFVEALIMEVSAERIMELGVQWQGGSGNTYVGSNFPGNGRAGIIGLATAASNTATAGAAATALAGTSGLIIGVAGGGITIPGIGKVTDLGFLAHALEREAGGNVLSTPNVMTLDNEEAKIVIGQNVPFLTGSYSNSGGSSGASNPFQTFERKDVGLTLKILPQISEGGMIHLKIFQEVSSVDEASRNNPAGLTTNKRSIETTVNVADGNIIAIGGLIQETVADGEDKVPLLGDIPVLGHLFRYERKTRKKSNLMVFLKPVILRDEAGARALAGERYNYLIGESEKVNNQKLSLDPIQAFKAVPSNSLKSQLDSGSTLLNEKRKP